MHLSSASDGVRRSGFEGIEFCPHRLQPSKAQGMDTVPNDNEAHLADDSFKLTIAVLFEIASLCSRAFFWVSIFSFSVIAAWRSLLSRSIVDLYESNHIRGHPSRMKNPCHRLII
jgi:hypothetical protein